MENAKKKRHGTGHRSHAACVACGPANPAGLKLRFSEQPDGSVRAAAFCRKEVMGYDGLLHGGVAALMLDSAMTNCLFSRGIPAFTAELNIKYRKPVSIGRAVEVSGAVVKDMDPLFKMKAELLQDGAVCVSAEAKFMRNSF